jgi:hypothetical protein
MSNKIRIETVTGGDTKDRDDLKSCYFESTGVAGNYNFFDKHDTQIPTVPSPLTSGTNFTFTKNQTNWNISRFLITDATASGNWTNDHEISEGQGSFQAQAGTIEGEESASAAKGSY